MSKSCVLSKLDRCFVFHKHAKHSNLVSLSCHHQFHQLCLLKSWRDKLINNQICFNFVSCPICCSIISVVSSRPKCSVLFNYNREHFCLTVKIFVKTIPDDSKIHSITLYSYPNIPSLSLPLYNIPFKQSICENDVVYFRIPNFILIQHSVIVCIIQLNNNSTLIGDHLFDCDSMTLIKCTPFNG